MKPTQIRKSKKLYTLKKKNVYNYMIQKYGLDWDLHWILNWTEAVNILSENVIEVKAFNQGHKHVWKSNRAWKLLFLAIDLLHFNAKSYLLTIICSSGFFFL